MSRAIRSKPPSPAFRCFFASFEQKKKVEKNCHIFFFWPRSYHNTQIFGIFFKNRLIKFLFIFRFFFFNFFRGNRVKPVKTLDLHIQAHFSENFIKKNFLKKKLQPFTFLKKKKNAIFPNFGQNIRKICHFWFSAFFFWYFRYLFFIYLLFFFFGTQNLENMFFDVCEHFGAKKKILIFWENFFFWARKKRFFSKKSTILEKNRR